jgi:hypothetical protein
VLKVKPNNPHQSALVIHNQDLFSSAACFHFSSLTDPD